MSLRRGPWHGRTVTKKGELEMKRSGSISSAGAETKHEKVGKKKKGQRDREREGERGVTEELSKSNDDIKNRK